MLLQLGLVLALYGDSNTDNGYRGSELVARASVDTQHDSTQLSGILERQGFRVLNRAVGGSTSRLVLTRFSADADYVYVSAGTNDCRYGGTYTETVVNLRQMIELWTAKHPADRFIVTTIPPTPDHPECRTDIANRRIRQIATDTGVRLIDLARYTSADDGLTWRDCTLPIKPGNVHYRTPVREWLAREIIKATGVHHANGVNE
jgi:lysophospholipase L1-like esterase